MILVRHVVVMGYLVMFLFLFYAATVASSRLPWAPAVVLFFLLFPLYYQIYVRRDLVAEALEKKR